MIFKILALQYAAQPQMHRTIRSCWVVKLHLWAAACAVQLQLNCSLIAMRQV